MLFNSLQFIFIFLPITWGVSYFLKGQKLLGWITVISFVFYGTMGGWWFLVPMTVTVVIDYFVAIILEKQTERWKRNALLSFSLVANVGLLVFFKYSEFLAENALALFHLFGGKEATPGWIKWLHVILPAGISFYTFQTLSYILDVWNRRCPAERNFTQFVAFVTFFPHLVAGPLTRHNQLIPQLESIAVTGIRPRVQEGLLIFIMGLCKKVLIADRIGSIIDPALAQMAQNDLVSSWLLLLGYTFQIYFDFSGYSDMAIGLGRLWGIELPLNFNSPYQALNPSDFWKRWHITLSQWLRDYIYIPLGGNRGSNIRRDINLMATMCIGGFWHGANWNFIFWGFYHGALLIIYRYAAGVWDRQNITLQKSFMFLLTVLGWLLFRADNMEHLKLWVQGLAGLRGFAHLTMGSENLRDLLFLSALVIFAYLVARLCQNAFSLSKREKFSLRFEMGLGLAAAAAIVLMNYSSRFLYFRF